MARRKTLTDTMIAKLKPGPKRLTLPDPELRGLYPGGKAQLVPRELHTAPIHPLLTLRRGLANPNRSPQL